jgi:hypothetical protein
MMKYRWTLLAIAYFLGVLLADVLVTPHQNFTGLLTLTPVLLALEWSPLIVTLGSVPLVVLAADNAFGTNQSTTEGIVVRTIGIVVGIGIGAYLAYFRQQRATTLDLSRAATEAAHRAILPAVPASVGSYRLSTAYRSASEESLIGGDFYKVIETDAGIRLIVGDVQGKGLDAIAMTAAVLGCFREWAPETDSLQQLVERLDARVMDKASGARLRHCGSGLVGTRPRNRSGQLRTSFSGPPAQTLQGWGDRPRTTDQAPRTVSRTEDLVDTVVTGRSPVVLHGWALRVS